MPETNGVSHLRQGLVLSVIFHAFLFSFFADILALTVADIPDAEGEVAIQAILHQPRPEQMVPTPEQPSAPSILVIPAQRASDRVKTKVPALLPEKPAPQPLAPVPDAQNKERSEAFDPIGSKGSTLPDELPPPSPPKPPSADDLRQYLLEIGRGARRHKHYPLLARERGIEGIVVVVVSTRAGLAVPQVSLSSSSGASMLDAQALETVGRAVRDTKMPDALLNRDFAVDLPIQFSLGD